jgi:5'-methylthioadenosine phosphorylase
LDAGIAVIGGVGFDLEGPEDTVETPYGGVLARTLWLNGRKAVFLPRHGERHLPPHKVNYRATLWAAQSCGAERVIAINTVGTMSYHNVGSFFLPFDFVEFTRSRSNTFYEESAVHVDMSQPYCHEIRSCLIDAMSELSIAPFEGVYVCAEGPHLESPAQIRMMRQFGDVVGMTGYPEVVLARELGLCYASLCIVTNEACGMREDGPISLLAVMEEMKRASCSAKEIIIRAAARIPAKRACSCSRMD